MGGRLDHVGVVLVLRIDSVPDWARLVDAAVADYRGHPGLGGYLVDDEPNPPEFPDVAKVVGRLRATDPRSLAYGNLLPSYIRGPDGDTHQR